MEATGQYWKPIWYVLEDRGFDLKLVNARHVKMVPGRKTDLADAAWLAELLEHGLLRSSFVPPAAIRELRDLTRYRKRLIQTHTAEQQRVQKVLEDAGIKLDSVASDVLGVSGRAMLRALIDGERDPERAGGAGQGHAAQEDPAAARSAARPVQRPPRRHAPLILGPRRLPRGGRSPRSTIEVDRVIAPFR